MKLSAELKAYVVERVIGPVQRFYDDSAAELRVELGDTNGPKGGNDQECHLTLRMPGASVIHIEEVTSDIYASIDGAGERLVQAGKREVERHRHSYGHQKYRPLATVVAEGGVPGGLIEELPKPASEEKKGRRPKK